MPAPDRTRPCAYQSQTRARHSTYPPARTRRRHRRVGAAIAAAGIVAVVALVALRGLLSNPGTASSTQEASATSTPRAEWKRGTVPALYQIDPQWADEPYAGGTIRENGCGPTCLSMVYVALTGNTDRDPAAMARFSEEGGHVADNMTAWTLMTDGAAQLGLTSTELPADAGSVRDELSQGHPIICSVRPGDFTQTGHFIVLVGIDTDGSVIVHDPNSAARTQQSWDLDRVLGQCANLWAFSA